ncbi:MAG: conjugal transfer protein TraG N-terminal domain-containing protein [Sutterella parvirubra]|nr:conjugal transfer protein TraG N-terminal domain-containing protein [Sutterella parvirubra]
MITFDFYAYWNGEEVATLFSSVTGLFGSSEYHTLLAVAALAGFLAVAAIAAVRYRAGDMVQYFFAALLLYFVAFVPKATVVVIDERVAFTRAVEGVPLGVAFTAAVTSGIGHWATEAFETAFTDVDAARFSKFGMAFPERAAEAVRNAGPIVPEVRTFVKEFVARCIAPEVADKPEKLRELMAAPDIPTLLQNKTWVNPARLLMREGSVLYCSDAWGTLEQELRTKEIPAQEKLLATKLAGTEKDVVVAMVRQAVPESESLMYGVSRSMEESLKHSLLLNAIPEGIRTTADRSGTPLATAVQISKSQGNLASEISYRTMQTLAASFLPKFRNILEFILIAASPFIFLSMIIVGSEGGKVYRMYFTLFFWLALWAPMAAVVNFLILHVDLQPMNLLVEQFGGVTMAAMDLIRSEGATSQAMAGYVMTLIPVISFVIAKASDIGVTSLASSVMNPAQSAAAAQSSSLAMGNVSVGNVSSGNVSANSTSMNAYDASLKRVDGARYQNTTAWGTVTRDMNTGEVTGVSAEPVNMGVHVTSSMSDQGTLTRNIASSTGYSQTNAVSTGNDASLSRDNNVISGDTTTSGTSSGSANRWSEASSNVVQMRSGHERSVMFGDAEQAGTEESVGILTQYRGGIHIGKGVGDESLNPEQNTPNKNFEPANIAPDNSANNLNITNNTSEGMLSTNQPIIQPENQNSNLIHSKAPTNNNTSTLSKVGDFAKSTLDVLSPDFLGALNVSIGGNGRRNQSTNTQHTFSEGTGANETRSFGNTVNHDRTNGTSYAESSELRDQNGLSKRNTDVVSDRQTDTSHRSADKTTTTTRGESGGVTVSADIQRVALAQARQMFSNMSDEEFLRMVSDPAIRMAFGQNVRDAMAKDDFLNPAQRMPMQTEALEEAHDINEKAQAQSKKKREDIDQGWIVGHQGRLADKPQPNAPVETPDHLMTREEYEGQKAELEQGFDREASVHQQYFKGIGLANTVKITHLKGFGYESPEKLRKSEEEKE